MRFLNLIVIAFFMAVFGCKKPKPHDPECAIPAIVPYQPYSDPVWHPNGQLLGFNHTPQAGVFANGTSPCTWYMNSVKQDSAGFYLMNKDGKGFRRVTNFYLITPAWSPDGNWIAFSMPPHIYKMRFDGYAFDTAQIWIINADGSGLKQLTNTQGYSCDWSPDGTKIVYTDSRSSNGRLWVMNADGSSKQQLTFFYSF